MLLKKETQKNILEKKHWAARSLHIFDNTRRTHGQNDYWRICNRAQACDINLYIGTHTHV